MNWQVIDRWKAWNCIKNYIILSFIVKIIDTTIIFNLFEVTSNSFLSLFSSDLIFPPKQDSVSSPMMYKFIPELLS